MALKVVDTAHQYDDDTLTVTAEVLEQPGWRVDGVFTRRDPGFLLVAVRVYSTNPDTTGGVNATVMRDVRLSDLHAGLVMSARTWRDFDKALGSAGIHASPALTDHLGRLYDAIEVGSRSTRHLSGEQMYAVWAARYVEALGSGNPPIAELARRWPNVDRKKASNLVDQARRRGLLTRPGKGSTSGTALTPKALQLLAEMES